MRFKYTKNMNKNLFKNYYEILTLIDKHTADEYIKQEQTHPRTIGHVLFTYKECVISHSEALPYVKYDWCVFNYDGSPESDTRHLCGSGQSMEDIIEQIDEAMKN